MNIRLAIPSDGELHESCLSFLRNCGLNVERPSLRSYVASIPAIPGANVLFQRASDITQKVEEGSAELGIVGLDRFMENSREETQTIPLLKTLEFGRCELVVAVPDSWVDVSCMDDLADLAVEFRGSGQDLRLVTKYPRLVQHFLFARDIHYFTLISSSGALEAAPAAGYADMIVDISSSGTTLRENHLKTLADGTLMTSQACLIGNLDLLKDDPGKLEVVRQMLEHMESYLEGQKYYSISANLLGISPEAISQTILEKPELAGLKGPTVTMTYSPSEGNWYAVNLVIKKDLLMSVIVHLRQAGGVDIAVHVMSYLMRERNQAYEDLLEALGRI